MTIDELCAYMAGRGIAFQRDGNTLSAGGALHLDSLTSLPEGVTLSAGGALNLGGLTSLPEGVTLSAGGWLYLSSLTSLPEGVTLSAGGWLYLSSLTSLPEGVTLSAGAWLDLSGLTSLPDGVTLSACGAIHLNGLTSLPEGVTLSAGGALNLGGLTSLPEGVTLSAGAWLDLSSLTALSDGVTLSARWSLYLGDLVDEWQTYQGRRIRICTIDGCAMHLIRARAVSPSVTLWSAQYFRGHLDTDPRCYIAQEGDIYAHGDTPDQALRDLRFKIAYANFDVDDLVAEIRERGTVTFNDYRLLTGACESGLREGLRARGIDPDIDEMPLADALRLSADGYGGDRFAELMG